MLLIIRMITILGPHQCLANPVNVNQKGHCQCLSLHPRTIFWVCSINYHYPQPTCDLKPDYFSSHWARSWQPICQLHFDIHPHHHHHHLPDGQVAPQPLAPSLCSWSQPRFPSSRWSQAHPEHDGGRFNDGHDHHDDKSELMMLKVVIVNG